MFIFLKCITLHFTVRASEFKIFFSELLGQVHIFICHQVCIWASLIAQLVKNLPAIQETLVQLLGRGQGGDGFHPHVLGGNWISSPLQGTWGLPW